MQRAPSDSQHVRREPSRELDALAHAVVGAAIEVHRHLGPGYLETTYEEAFAIELHLRGIGFERQVPVPVLYKGHPVTEGRADFLAEKALIIELKAVEALAAIYEVQLKNYLKATGIEVGLLINFGRSVEIKRKHFKSA